MRLQVGALHASPHAHGSAHTLSDIIRPLRDLSKPMQPGGTFTHIAGLSMGF